MKKKLFLLLPLFALLLIGCGSRTEKSQYQIYYLSTDGTNLISADYEPQSAGTEGLINEFLAQLSTDVDSVDYMKPIPNEVEIEDYQLSDGALSIYFDRDYYTMENYSEVLMRASIVKTILQVDGVDNITFYVSNSPLVDSAGNVIGSMSADTFIEDFGEETDSLLNTTLILYFASADGQSLVKEEKNVYYSSNVPLEKLVLEYLLKGPDSDNAKSAIPANTKVVGVTVTDGVCYVNLNSTFFNQVSDVSEQVVIYSIVNSLTELDSVNKVQISVNGDTTGAYYDEYQLSTIYESNMDIVIENKKENEKEITLEEETVTEESE